ncbi:MAG: hypothetical protein NTU80_06430 [Verrucomicrobia bacterium]|nr:hypothetical protein [Verrucomicrobiota bacterium]
MLTASGGLSSPGGIVNGGATGLTLNAGGTNQNITLTPSGTGWTTTGSTLRITNATASTNTTTGALTVAGGVGVAGTLNAGNLTTGGTLNAGTVTTTGTVNAGTLSVANVASALTNLGLGASSNADFGAINAADPTLLRLAPVSKITHVGTGPYLYSPQVITVSGTLAYVGSSSSTSLQILDVTNPLAPVKRGALVGNGTAGAAYLSYPRGIAISGNYAYVISQTNNALQVVNITNPDAPIAAGSLVNGAGGAVLAAPLDIAISGTYAYIASWSSNALEIVNIANPAAPVHAGKLVDATALLGARAVAVSGNYAYVVSSTGNRFAVINISNPAAPTLVTSLVHNAAGPLLSGATAIALSGNYAYVISATSNALQVIDISNPALPVAKGSLVSGTAGAQLLSPTAVSVVGTLAYVTAGGSTKALQIVDVSNPLAPTPKGQLLDTMGGAALNGPTGIAVSGNYAYVTSAGSNNALQILSVTPGGGFQVKGSTVLTTNAANDVLLGSGQPAAKVAIGTTNATARLTVAGTDTAATSSAANFTDSTGKSLLIVKNDGKVGVGTSNPSEQLEVAGNVKAQNFFIKRYSLPADGKFHVVASGGGQWGRIAYMADHASPNQPALSSGEIMMINDKFALVMRHKTAQYGPNTNLQFARSGNTAEGGTVWVKNNGTIPANFYITEAQNVSISLDGTSAALPTPGIGQVIYPQLAGDTETSESNLTLAANSAFNNGWHRTLTFENIQPHDQSRNPGVVSGSINFNYSQPTSGVSQLGAQIQGISDYTQSGGDTPTAITFGTFNSSYYSHIGATGFSERMRISSNGNVGIGTSTPSASLDVGGAVQISAQASTTPPAGIAYGLFGYTGVGLGIVSRAEGPTQGIGFWTNYGNNLRESVRITADGNLGIGTTTPTAKLEVSGDIKANGNLVLTTASANIARLDQSPTFNPSSYGNYNEGIRVNDAPNGYAILKLGGTGTSGTATGNWTLFKHPNGDLVYNNGAQEKVHFFNNRVRFSDNVVSSRLIATANSNIENYAINGAWTGASLVTNSIEIVNNEGVVNNSSPTLAFHRYGSGGPQFRLDAAGTNVLYLESANGNSARSSLPYGGGGNNFFTRLHVDGQLSTTGNVGIGTSTPTAKLDVAGDANINGKLLINGKELYSGTSIPIPNGLGDNPTPWYIIDGDAASSILYIIAEGSYAQNKQLIQTFTNWNTATVKVISKFDYGHLYLPIEYGVYRSGTEARIAIRANPAASSAYDVGSFRISSISNPDKPVVLTLVDANQVVAHVNPEAPSGGWNGFGGSDFTVPRDLKVGNTLSVNGSPVLTAASANIANNLGVGASANTLSSGWKGTGVFGQDSFNKVVVGPLVSNYSGATIGANNSNLNDWADLNITGSNLIFRTNGETETARLTSNGRLGIGTTDPTTKLEVAGNAKVNGNFTVKGGHTDTQLFLTSDHFSQGVDGANTASLTMWASEPGMSWTGAGIGNNIVNNNPLNRITATRGASYIRLLDNAVVMSTFNNQGANTNNIIMSDTNVTLQGNVGIGTTTPSAKLEVAGDAKITGSLAVTKRVTKLRVERQGDIAMGPFTTSPAVE